MEWDVDECIGTAKLMRWSTAMESCPENARLPALDEIVAILTMCDLELSIGVNTEGLCDTCEDSSSLCGSIFENELTGLAYPNDYIQDAEYWTSTKKNDTQAYAVDFADGYSSSINLVTINIAEKLAICVKD